MSKDDMFTKIYFRRLTNNENSMFMSAYKNDIEGLWVFIYYSYYIPNEIKKIIKKELNLE